MLLLLLHACRLPPDPWAPDDTGSPAPILTAVPEELCNDLDDDGDGAVDEDLPILRLHPDRDGDGFGDDGEAEVRCLGEGWIEAGSDCDDADPAVSPAAEEACDGVENDCDRAIDEQGAAGCVERWRDADGDGVGEEAGCVCEVAEPWTATVGGDCDDGEPYLAEDCTEGPVRDLSEARARLSNDGEGFFALDHADVDGDGDQDLVLVTQDWETVFAAPVPARGDTGAFSTSLGSLFARTSADLDGDGVLDQVRTTESDRACWYDYTLYHCSFTATLEVARGPMGAEATTALRFETRFLDGDAVTAWDADVIDIDGDGVIDAVLGRGDDQGVAFWRAPTEVGGTVVAEEIGPAMEAASGSFMAEAWEDTRDFAAVGDVDGDGFDDLWFRDAVYAGPLAAPGALDGWPARLAGAYTGAPLATGDMTGDGLDDVALRFDHEVWVLPGPVAGETLEEAASGRMEPEDPGDWVSVIPGDADGDGLVDLVASAGGGAYLVLSPLTGTRDLSQADARWYGASGAAVLDDGTVALYDPTADAGDGRLGAVLFFDP